jgi:hypothetical protein
MKKLMFFAVEVVKPHVAPAIGSWRPGRRDKLTNPIFITPGGVIEEFPTQDVHFFSSPPLAPILPSFHPRIPDGSGWAVISRVDLERSTRYLRWLNGKREDTRATIEESYAVFVAEGRDGLKKRFSKTHVFYLLREFKKQGWATDWPVIGRCEMSAIEQAVEKQSKGTVIPSHDDIATIQRYQETGLDLTTAAALFLTQRALTGLAGATTN